MGSLPHSDPNAQALARSRLAPIDLDPVPANACAALTLAGECLAAALNTRVANGDRRAPFVEVDSLYDDVEILDGREFISAFDLLKRAAGAVVHWARVTS